MGENITFSCITSNSYLIWEIVFIDRTIGSTTHSFQESDRQGKFYSESIHGVHLYYQLTSNRNGILDSRLVAHTSALLENAVIECHATQTRHLTVRLACKCIHVRGSLDPVENIHHSILYYYVSGQNFLDF